MPMRLPAREAARSVANALRRCARGDLSGVPAKATAYRRSRAGRPCHDKDLRRWKTVLQIKSLRDQLRNDAANGRGLEASPAHGCLEGAARHEEVAQNVALCRAVGARQPTYAIRFAAPSLRFDGRNHRKFKRENRALADFACHLDSPAMFVGDAPGNRQA